MPGVTVTKHRKCDVCGKEIVLSPSAAERARKYGGTPSDYLDRFKVCTDCVFEMRDNKPHPSQPGVAKKWLEAKQTSKQELKSTGKGKS